MTAHDEARQRAREKVRGSVERSARVLLAYALEADALTVRPLLELAEGKTDGWDTDDGANVEVTVSDLIADLLHFARAYGMDTDGVLSSAQRHHEAERLNAIDGSDR